MHLVFLSTNGSRGARTLDSRIKSPMLYQLSYRPLKYHRRDSNSHEQGKNLQCFQLHYGGLLFTLFVFQAVHHASLPLMSRLGNDPSSLG
jgi:hypothetical protein